MCPPKQFSGFQLAPSGQGTGAFSSLKEDAVYGHYKWFYVVYIKWVWDICNTLLLKDIEKINFNILKSANTDKLYILVTQQYYVVSFCLLGVLNAPLKMSVTAHSQHLRERLLTDNVFQDSHYHVGGATPSHAHGIMTRIKYALQGRTLDVLRYMSLA